MGIWNLNKGDIFFTGRIILFQNYIKKAWEGKYSLSTLDSFAQQFLENTKGKEVSNRDHYYLWPNYKKKERSRTLCIQQMLKDVPDNFSPQKDAPDFFALSQGEKIILKDSSIEVFTSTAIVPNDFGSILKAAKTIVSSFYCEESPTGLYFIKSRICMDSLDVGNIEKTDPPEDLDFDLSSAEEKAVLFSFTIYFDLEICSKYPTKGGIKYECSQGANKIYNLDFILLYVNQVIFFPGKIHLDKENCFYFVTPKDHHTQDEIYAVEITESLSKDVWLLNHKDSTFLWMNHYASKDIKELKGEMKKLIPSFNQENAIKEYIEKYGHKGKVSKKIFMEHLKRALDANPLDFTDDENDFIAAYAKLMISGESI